MAALATLTAATSGTALTFPAAAGGGDTAKVGAGHVLLVRNGSGSSINVTLVTPGTVQALAIADQVVAVAAGVTTAISLDPSLYGNSTGDVAIAYSLATTVTVQVIAI